MADHDGVPETLEERVERDKRDAAALAVRCREVRAASGSVDSSDPLVVFLYILMRDRMPTGVVEGLVHHVAKIEHVSTFMNGWLARYAMNLAAMLEPPLMWDELNPADILHACQTIRGTLPEDQRAQLGVEPSSLHALAKLGEQWLKHRAASAST